MKISYKLPLDFKESQFILNKKRVTMSKLFYKRETTVPYNGKTYKFIEILEELPEHTQKEEIVDLTIDEEDQPSIQETIDLTTSDKTDQSIESPKHIDTIPSPQYSPISPEYIISPAYFTPSQTFTEKPPYSPYNTTSSPYWNATDEAAPQNVDN